MASIASDSDVEDVTPATKSTKKDGRKPSDYRFGITTFKDDVDKLDVIATKLDQTAWILKQLCQGKDASTARILDNAQGKVVRLWQPKSYRIDGDLHIKRPQFEKSYHLQGMALYLFQDEPIFDQCDQCKKDNQEGPSSECISFGEDVIEGACTNCYGTGQGQRCSLREKLKAEKKAMEARVKGYMDEPTPAKITRLTTEQVEQMLSEVTEVIDKRTATMYSKRS
ncbi:hypothetical protein SCUP515_13348 [Seiridium cupressi]